MTDREEPAVERAEEWCSRQREQHIKKPHGKNKLGREEKQVPRLYHSECRSKGAPVVPRQGGGQTASHSAKVLKSVRPDPTQYIRPSHKQHWG